jgi:membrane protease subunit HflC
MMSRNALTVVAALLVVVMILVSSSVYTVGEAEKAIKFQLGEILDTNSTPGLHFKIPFINKVKVYNAKLLTLESKPERFLTSEKKNVIVDYFAKWKIKDVARFYTSVQGDIVQANIRLEQIVQAAMKDEFSKRTIREVVSSERGQIRDILIKAANPSADELGIEIVDIRIMRVELPSEVSSSVFRRMESERAGVARDFRSKGAEKAERIRADADRQREVILGDAYRDAELKRGEGDATAADIYAQAYGKDKSFFSFYRSLTAYKQAFKNEGDTIVLEPDSEFFQYFKKSK